LTVAKFPKQTKIEVRLAATKSDGRLDSVHLMASICFSFVIVFVFVSISISLIGIGASHF
jgi:hypothetical protein